MTSATHTSLLTIASVSSSSSLIVLFLLTNNSHITSISVSDTAANILTNLATLQADASHITSITASDSNPLNITAAQLVSDATALAKLTGDTINVTNIPTGSAQTLVGSDGDLNFHFAINMPGSPSATKFDSITGWTGNDVISFTSALKVAGFSGTAQAGEASINGTTGLVTFNASDNTLALELAAVEKAIANGSNSTAVAAGDVAMWANGSNTFVLITGAHTGTAIGANDTLIELVGVSTSHVALHSGTVVV